MSGYSTSMHITRLAIDGFRSIRHAQIDFNAGKNVIVGRNNSGKSNIVRALDIMLGVKHPSFLELDQSDFYCSDQGEKCSKIWIVCKIEGNDVDLEKIKSLKNAWRCVLDNVNPFRSNVGQLEIDEREIFFELEDKEYFYKADPNNPDGVGKRYFKGLDLKDLADSFERSPIIYLVYRAIYDVAKGRSVADFRVVYRDPQIKRWCVVPNVSNDMREAFTTSAILPAFREPLNQLRINKYTWYGKMLKHIWLSKVDSAEVSDGMQQALKAIQVIGEPIFKELSDDINSKIRIGFRDSTVRLHFVSHLPEDVHKQVQIFVNDGIEDVMGRKGSGVQSAVVIGLFSYYCRLFHKNTSVLVVEEPEIYLHPHARKAISRRLDEFVDVSHRDGSKNQVIVTTHSSEILKTGYLDAITVVSKDMNGTQAKTLKLDNSILSEKEKRNLFMSESTEMFFADKVILCEGAEYHLVPRIADALLGYSGSLDERNISVISCGGKLSFSAYASALDKLGIQYYIISDLDYMTLGIDQLIPSDPYYNTIKEELGIIRTEILRELEGTPIEKVFKNYKLNDLSIPLQQRIRDILSTISAELDIWILREGMLEDYVNTSNKGAELLDGKRKVSISRLADICRDDSTDISEYINQEEFITFINTIVLKNDPFSFTEQVKTLT